MKILVFVFGLVIGLIVAFSVLPTRETLDIYKDDSNVVIYKRNVLTGKRKVVFEIHKTKIELTTF